jgi:Dolichyl-phosphate-mannose-protein mannosyltransferase
MIAGAAERIAGRIGPDEKKFAGFEASVERLTNRYRFVLIGGICLLYLAATMELARRKLFWTDEFFTLFLGRLNVGELWKALVEGGDSHPPSFYLMHHMFLRVFGENPWGLRLPAILGFLLMMLCVYRFVAKRTSVGYGLVAMLMPLGSTMAYEFAYEARGYSPLLGFLALAVVCWQQAGERKWRRAALLGLGASLTAAVLSHYYTVFLLPAIAAAEATRSIRCESWKPGVWMAMSTSVIPLIAFLPVIKTASGYAATFWGKASLSEIHLYYENILGSAVTCFLFCFALAGLYRVLFRRDDNSAIAGSRTFPVEEIVLAIAIAGAPVIAYLFGKAITGVFVWRYAIGGLVGIAILFGFLCFRVFRGSTIAAGLIVFSIAAYFAMTARMNMRTLSDRQANLRDLIAWLASTGNDSEPLIIADSQSFYVLSYYSPPAMKQRYVYLADTKRSLKYLGQDAPDRSLSRLYPWFGLNVKPYGLYVESHPKMNVWEYPNPKWSWLLSGLIDDGKKLTVVGRLGTTILFSIGPAEVTAQP